MDHFDANAPLLTHYMYSNLQMAKSNECPESRFKKKLPKLLRLTLNNTKTKSLRQKTNKSNRNNK